MIATRERPDVAVKVRQEFDGDCVGDSGNEIALRHFKFVALKRTSFGKQVIASTRGEDQKIGGLPLTVDAITRFCGA